MPKFPSIGYGLFLYQYEMQRGMNMPMYFAALLITAIPGLILFMIFQDKILVNVTIGGLKG
jgi:ABC-type maltose transport system permease subunit